MATLTTNGKCFEICCTYEERAFAKSIFGAKWHSYKQCWEYPLRPEVFEEIKKTFPHLEISPEAQKIYNDMNVVIEKFHEFPVKTSMYDHQIIGAELTVNVLLGGRRIC